MSIDDMSKVKNIFDLIDKIEQRTGMFIPDKSIESLSNLLFGYSTCLKIHDIIEKDGPDFNYFGDWLRQKFNWNLVYGWARAIKQNCTDSEDPLARFFSLVKDFSSIEEIEFKSRSVLRNILYTREKAK